jgi:hypothetical protein
LCLLLPCLGYSTERRRTPPYIHTKSPGAHPPGYHLPGAPPWKPKEKERQIDRMTNRQKQIERTRHPTSSSHPDAPLRSSSPVDLWSSSPPPTSGVSSSRAICSSQHSGRPLPVPSLIVMAFIKQSELGVRYILQTSDSQRVILHNGFIPVIRSDGE